MYNPAVTIVAAWISADTGVGPSIASGSQTKSGICADELNQVSGFEVVQIIGKTFTLYCPHPEEPKIQLPAE